MTATLTKIKLGDTVTVDGWSGIAFHVHGYPKRWEAETCLIEDQDGNEFWMTTDEGEWVDDADSGDLIVVMVGDDREHRVSAEDCTLIDRDAYCGECGQVGCGW